jgi:hypothetical protein
MKVRFFKLILLMNRKVEKLDFAPEKQPIEKKGTVVITSSFQKGYAFVQVLYC